jgi:hypothetical protein
MRALYRAEIALRWPGPAACRHQRDTRPVGEPRPGIGHVDGGRLVARVIEGERPPDRRVVDREDLVARQREEMLHACRHQRLDQRERRRRHQKIAIGCAGAPVAPVNRNGVAVKRNS